MGGLAASTGAQDSAAETTASDADGTRFAGWAAAIASLFFVSGAVAYWVTTRSNPGACTFARPDCSTAAATWALCFITTGAFIAAYEAARKAGGALRVSTNQLALEQALVLGLRQSTVYQKVVSRVELFVVNGAAENGPAQGKTEKNYVPVVFTFENLGRTALQNLWATLQINESAGKPVEIGNIRPDNELHVFLYVDWDEAPPTVCWLPRATVNGKPLDYLPPPRVAIAGISDRNRDEPVGDARKWTFRKPEDVIVLEDAPA